MQPSTRDFLTSPYFTLLQTHNGGRSLFATLPIPANTLIHISHSPSASVIYREYRKFVCAWCFGYNDEGRGGWCMTSGEHNGGRRFCAETCRDFWIAEGMRCGGLKERVDKAIDAAVHRMNKYRARSKQTQSHADFALPDNTLEITQATLDAAWKAAHCEATTIIQLNEMELEIARFVSSALVHLYTTSLKPVTFDDHRSILLLQQNELPHTLQRPYILPAHIRISKFLRTALACIPEMRTYISMEADGDCWVRRILGRDAGNSFGIWEQASDGDHAEARKEGDKEMFGWGIWVDASFFNHSCTPNVTKSRSSRALHFTTTKAINTGEELCISYIDVGTDLDNDLDPCADVANYTEDRRERGKKLWEQWFFVCACRRCSREQLRATHA